MLDTRPKVTPVRQVRGPEVNYDSELDSIYYEFMPWDVEPPPDPEASSIEQYKNERYKNEMPLGKVLHAYEGDPERDLEKQPPYVRTFPRGVEIGACPEVSSLRMDNKHGNIITGSMTYRAPAERHHYGGVCNLNPLLMTALPSTTVTPISTMLFSVTVPPLQEVALMSPVGSPAQRAVDVKKSGKEAAKWETPHNVLVVTEGGIQVEVSGVYSMTEARAFAMSDARTEGYGTTVARMEDLGEIRNG